ncbi:MAG: aminotransferase class I/II-fold pyridoxal phosphate-dependent enzyme [Chloroflexi bacterium]|nr:aminotransferase class I/II-fold pyridoxal phosphate-dependent enzyme [Chloroflexota bacterium]
MEEPSRPLSFSTLAVHAGEQAPPPGVYPVGTPIYQTSSFYYERSEDLDAVFEGTIPGYVYTRYGNPTTAALERAVAALEGAEGAVAFASGMAAIHAALLALELGPGDTLLASRDLYGMTQALFLNLFAPLGVRVQWVDMGDLSAVRQALEAQRPKVTFLETVSNPLLRVADVAALAELCRPHGTALVVDATFTSPYLCQPLALGARLVVHSATKYLGGHGDVTGGLAVGGAHEVEQLRAVAKLVGGILPPSEAWLTLRGLKTLPLRLQRQCDNALAVARWLAAHPRVERVYYPGLEDHPHYDLARRMFRPGCSGAVVAFDLRAAGAPEVLAFMDRLRLCLPAPTLGDIYSLVLYPARASHRALSPAQRRTVGIGDGLVRLSLGIEDAADIIADLEQALAW